MQNEANKLIAEAISEHIYFTAESEVSDNDIRRAKRLLPDVDFLAKDKEELATLLLQEGY